MIPDWKQVIAGAYSMQAFYMIIILESVLTALASVSPELAPSGTVQSVAVILLAALGGIGRVIAQASLTTEEPTDGI